MLEQNLQVLVIGDAGIDIVVHLPEISEDGKADFKEPFLLGGGTSANTAVALSRLAMSTSFLGTIGDDAQGKQVIEELQHEGVNIDHLMVNNDLNTFSTFAFIDQDGERHPYIWPKHDLAFQSLNRNQLNHNIFQNVSWVHSSGISMLEDTSARQTILSLFKEAKELGLTTSFDLNLRVDSDLDSDYYKAIMETIQYTDYVLGSGEDEFHYLSTEQNWLDTVKQLVSANQTFIARMGDQGALAVQQANTIKASGYPIGVVDTLGAGDIFNAGFIYACMKGYSIEESLKYANATAAFSVRKEGARSSPTIDELETFLSSY
ncbi:carbohydrate kinase family protein [Alkalibacillus almallahensis]|uniref:carbohydrate kinase family protein n=1 Tax=Alkalibacillus almallahensis TaxID=1379154 RepID=UPI00141E549B|nr:sugar kinase [Alkalibacillus almallahensis]NIK12033.1 fructokinase [Alkalibacillus almallahensis]